MSVVWSCGGGTQSAAIAALIVRGDLAKPDLSIIADTGREAAATWRYFEGTLRPALAAIGVDLVRLPHSFDGTGWNTVDAFGGKEHRTVLIPMYTRSSGRVGQTSKYCSNEWKTRPIDRYCRSIGLTSGSRLIGFSIDEFERMRGFNPDAKWNDEYPLIERRMSRGDCVALVSRMGWPTAPRSSCWMCPYQSDHEWSERKDTDPEEHAAAIAFERWVQTVDPLLFLHRSGVPLDRVDFDSPQNDMLGDECRSGMCFT